VFFTYSSKTYSNVTAQAAIKIISNDIRICKAESLYSIESPSIIDPVNFTELIITGITIGKRRIGRRTSRSFVFSATAEKSVPTETKPIVPKNITSKRGSIISVKLKLKNKLNKGIMINSTMMTKMKFPIIFPKNKTLLSTGVRRSPIIEFPSFSIANERLSPNTPANVNDTHKMAGAANFMTSVERLKAKLKITSNSSANVNMADRSSLVLSSIIMSLYRIAMIFLMSQIDNPAASQGIST
jgi:hypothetical protein